MGVTNTETFSYRHRDINLGYITGSLNCVSSSRNQNLVLILILSS